MKESAAWDGSPRVTLRTVSEAESSGASASISVRLVGPGRCQGAPCPEVDSEAGGRSQPQSQGPRSTPPLPPLPQRPQEGRGGAGGVWRSTGAATGGESGGGWGLGGCGEQVGVVEARGEGGEGDGYSQEGTAPWAPPRHTVCSGWHFRCQRLCVRPPHHLIQAPPQTLLQWPRPLPTDPL